MNSLALGFRDGELVQFPYKLGVALRILKYIKQAPETYYCRCSTCGLAIQIRIADRQSSPKHAGTSSCHAISAP